LPRPQGYFAFPFKVDRPTVTYEAPGTPVTLGAGQLPGSRDVDYTAQQDPGFTTGVSYPSAMTPWVPTQGGGVAGPQWSYIQPGPQDDWAGSRPHTFTLRFTVDEPRDLTLSLWLLDSRSPTVDIALNGQSIRRFQPPSGSSVLPLPQVQAGRNTVTITTVAGSSLAYDGFAISG
jgi:hypothetical protein